MRYRLALLIGFAVFAGLLAVSIAALGFAHAYAELRPDSARCFTTFTTAQWPKWIGCAMAAHENLAGGLFGASGALFAAWLAYRSIQQQIAREGDERTRLHAQAKRDATLALTVPVHAAAQVLVNLRKALAAQTDEEIAEKDAEVRLSMDQLKSALENPTLQAGPGSLTGNDRYNFHGIFIALLNFTKFFEIQLKQGNREEQFKRFISILERLRRALSDFDAGLADEYAIRGEIPSAQTKS